MDMPKVSDEMKRLTELFAGTWRGEEKLYPSEWDPAGGPALGTWTVRPGVDGFCLLVDYDEERDGKVVYRGHGVHGWDSFAGGFHGFGQLFVVAVMDAGKLFNLPLQPLDHLARVAVQAGLTLHVAVKLVDTGFQRVDLGQGTSFLVAQGVALQHQPLQNGAGNRLFLALRRQGVLGRLAGFPAGA